MRVAAAMNLQSQIKRIRRTLRDSITDDHTAWMNPNTDLVPTWFKRNPAGKNVSKELIISEAPFLQVTHSKSN